MSFRFPFIFLVICLYVKSIHAQDASSSEEIKAFQGELNSEYKDPDKSPLSPKARKKFKKHEFFPIDLKFSVIARLDRNVDDKIFPMPTTTDRIANYKKYAVAVFVIDGVEHKLTVYQSVDLMKREEYKDYLFLPFTDKTTGDQTYGGGRYIDLRIPKTHEIVIDFNKAYNPYCAYSDRYSCPKVPYENHLEIEVSAGIKHSGKH
jgi:uncharacterized protein